MKRITFLLLVLSNFSFAAITSAEQPDEIFDEQEIVLSTVEEFPKHFRVLRYKYYFYVGDSKHGPIQESSVEMQGVCQGAGIKSPRGKDNIIGWTTADEELIPPYNHVVSSGLRAYHRLDLQALEYQFEYLGYLDMSGEFTSAWEKPYGNSLSSNKETIKLKIITESWDTYFERVRQKIC